MIQVNTDELKRILAEYTERTGIKSTDLSRRIAFRQLLSNTIYTGRIADVYVDKLLEALGYAGIDGRSIFALPTDAEQAPEATETAQSEQKAESRPDDQDLRKELQRLRDDVADLGIMINALRQDRQRDTEKLLQSLARIADGQLTQKALGEEIVSGIILAAGQMNIDEPIRSAYEAIRNDLQRDIYRAIKGGTK